MRPHPWTCCHNTLTNRFPAFCAKSVSYYNLLQTSSVFYIVSFCHFYILISSTKMQSCMLKICENLHDSYFVLNCNCLYIGFDKEAISELVFHHSRSFLDLIFSFSSKTIDVAIAYAFAKLMR